MISRLTNEELYTYLKLCEMNFEYLGLKVRLNNNPLDEDFRRTTSLRVKLYEEVNKRLKHITDKDDRQTKKSV